MAPSESPRAYWDRTRLPSPITAVWRYRWLILAITLIAAVLGFVITLLVPKTYTAAAGMVLNDPRAPFQRDVLQLSRDPVRHLRNEAENVESRQVAELTSELLGGGLSPSEVSDSISTSTSREGDLLRVEARASTPEEARDIANAVVDAYIQRTEQVVRQRADAVIVDLEELVGEFEEQAQAIDDALEADPSNRTLLEEEEALAEQIATTESRIRQTAIDRALYGAGVASVTRADRGTLSSTQSPARNAASAAIVAFFATGVLAWWRSESRPLAESRHDAAPILEAPLLGVVPLFSIPKDGPPVAGALEPRSAAAESYEFVVSALEFAMSQHGASTIVVTSPQAEDGKTVTVVNLAAAAVEDGHRALMIDADERKRGLSSLLGSRNRPGLTDLAVDGQLGLDDCVIDWDVGGNIRLEVVSAGTRPEHAAGFFRGDAFKKAMTGLRDRPGIKLVDTPPVLSVAEATDIASQADGIVVVVRKGTPLALLAEMRRRLDLVETPLLGYVFNGTSARAAGYGYGYGYGSDHDGEAAPEEPRAE